MTRDERSRQKKLERKRAKRREALAHKAKGVMAEWPSTEILAALPVHECWLNPNLFESGIGQAAVARAMPNGRLAVGVFLLDVYCLGIKNAFAQLMSISELREQVYRMREASNLAQASPAYVKKLIVDLESWARSIGFAPHEDYQDAKPVLAGIDAAECSEQFTFGKDGKPFFISGPYDRPFRVNHIMQTLMRTCGDGNFDYLVGVGGSMTAAAAFDEDDLDE